MNQFSSFSNSELWKAWKFYNIGRNNAKALLEEIADEVDSRGHNVYRLEFDKEKLESFLRDKQFKK